MLRIFKCGYPERTSVLDLWERLSSRDRFNSRLEAAPTGVFFSYLSLPDMRILNLSYWNLFEICFLVLVILVTSMKLEDL
jgi:hypothetical protein